MARWPWIALSKKLAVPEFGELNLRSSEVRTWPRLGGAMCVQFRQSGIVPESCGLGTQEIRQLDCLEPRLHKQRCQEVFGTAL